MYASLQERAYCGRHREPLVQDRPHREGGQDRLAHLNEFPDYTRLLKLEEETEEYWERAIFNLGKDSNFRYSGIILTQSFSSLTKNSENIRSLYVFRSEL